MSSKIVKILTTVILLLCPSGLRVAKIFIDIKYLFWYITEMSNKEIPDSMRIIMKSKNKHIGSDFDDFLKEEGILGEVETVAIKRVIAYQLEEELKKKHMTKFKMAEQMHTSRSSIDRLFDPENNSVTLLTLNKAAAVLGKKLKVELV